MARKLVIRSKYDLVTADMGKLVPIGIWEMLPNETVSHNTGTLIRVSPLAAPVMHPVTARVHHFFVPMRLLWPQKVGGTEGDNWEDFITGGSDGRNAAEIPTMTTTGVESDLLDYLGIPVKAGIEISALPIRAVNMIYNEWYRDQDLVNPREDSDTTVPNIAWEKDYFTAARPWSQKGPDVTIPIGGFANVQGFGKYDSQFTQPNTTVRESGGNARDYASSSIVSNQSAPERFLVEQDPENPGYPRLVADLAKATGASINDVRRAFAVQRYQENRAKWGSRYTEFLRQEFRARPQDSRLQRPEYLGGGRTQVNFSEVIQTAPDSTGDARFGVSDLYGHGIAAMRSNRYRRTVPEHGYILSFLSVRPKSMYMDGIDRHWLKKNKFDFYTPELKHIGQQEILKNEVYADASTGSETFGFQDRYSEYRHARSKVHAEFRNQLKYWHLGREFESMPVLNQSFVDCVPSKRIHNEQTRHSLWIMVQHRMKVLSPIGRNAPARIL